MALAYDTLNGRRRVVITGVGALTPIGIGRHAFWEGLCQGRSGVRRIRSFDTSPFPCHIGAEVDGFDPGALMDPRRAAHMARFSQFAVAAARLALEDSGLAAAGFDPERVGTCFGTTIGGGGDVFQREHLRFLRRGVSGVSPFSSSEFTPHATTAHVSVELGLAGPNLTISSGCGTGLDVVSWGRQQIIAGLAEAVVVGASEAPLFEFSFASFCALRILSERNDDPEHASRPYDLHRDGIVLGEGAAALVLEDLDHALDRRAPILAEVLAYASKAEALDVLHVEANGTALAAAIAAALHEASLAPSSLDYINSHGNSDQEYDICETRAFKSALGAAVYSIPISSIKSMLGQSLAAGGAMQVAATALALYHGVVPPTINYETPDPECDLDYTPNWARRARLRRALINAHSVGGTHAVLVLGAWPDHGRR